MSKPRLSDPRFAQDCECGTHIGPHWLHMDMVDRAETASLIKTLKVMEASVRDVVDLGSVHALARYIAEREIQRLKEKRREMERRGIECIPAEVTAAMAAYRQHHTASLKRLSRRKMVRRIAALNEVVTQAAAMYELADPDARRQAESTVAEAQQEIRKIQSDLAALDGAVVEPQQAEAEGGAIVDEIGQHGIDVFRRAIKNPNEREGE